MRSCKRVSRADDRLIGPSQTARARSRNIIRSPEACDRIHLERVARVADRHTIIVEQSHRGGKRSTRPLVGGQAFAAARAMLIGLELLHLLQPRPRVVEEGHEGHPVAALFSSLVASSLPQTGATAPSRPPEQNCDKTGKRACPPEDCGGIWGYASFLEALQDPQHPEHEEMVDWVGGEFDPEAFDLDEVNSELQNLTSPRGRRQR